MGPGVSQKSGDILQSTIAGVKAQITQLTDQINALNAKIRTAASGVTGSDSGTA